MYDEAEVHSPTAIIQPATPTLNTNGFGEYSTKRRRTVDDVDGEDTNHPALMTVPKSKPRETTPDPFEPKNRDKDICFYDDDTNDDYEWMRMPKKRGYDLFRVARFAPEDRNKAALPLVATRPDDGKQVTMWAKMDTGADMNIINLSTLKALLGESMKQLVQPNTFDRPKDFESMGHMHFETESHVKLSFTAGRSNKKFENIRFEVVKDDWEDPNGDGIPNVLLSYAFLREHSMIMMDLDYHCDANPDLPVIAQRAEDENPSQARILITKYPPTKGFVKVAGPKR